MKVLPVFRSEPSTLGLKSVETCSLYSVDLLRSRVLSDPIKSFTDTRHRRLSVKVHLIFRCGGYPFGGSSFTPDKSLSGTWPWWLLVSWVASRRSDVLLVTPGNQSKGQIKFVVYGLRQRSRRSLSSFSLDPGDSSPTNSLVTHTKVIWGPRLSHSWTPSLLSVEALGVHGSSVSRGRRVLGRGPGSRSSDRRDRKREKRGTSRLVTRVVFLLTYELTIRISVSVRPQTLFCRGPPTLRKQKLKTYFTFQGEKGR